MCHGLLIYRDTAIRRIPIGWMTPKIQSNGRYLDHGTEVFWMASKHFDFSLKHWLLIADYPIPPINSLTLSIKYFRGT